MGSSGAGGGGGGSTIAPGVRTTPNTTIPGQVAIDVALSAGVTGGDTLVGGTQASDPLTIASTGNATRGPINLRDFLALISEDKATLGATVAQAMLDVIAGRTFTLNSATVAANNVVMLRNLATYVWAANTGLIASQAINYSPVLKNDGSARTVQQLRGIDLTPTIRADTVAQTFTLLQLLSMVPVFDGVAGGVGTTTGAILQQFGATINAAQVVGALTHLLFNDATGAGTLSGPQVAIDIAAMAKGTTNTGIRNAAGYVAPPATKTITLSTDTIPINSEAVKLNNTTAGTVTLGGTLPVIPAGQQGQKLEILIQSAQSVVLPDQSTTPGSGLMLPGAVNLTLGQRDSLVLVFNTNLGNNWVCQSTSNN